MSDSKYFTTTKKGKLIIMPPLYTRVPLQCSRVRVALESFADGIKIFDQCLIT